jgi:hypothetical protein
MVWWKKTSLRGFMAGAGRKRGEEGCRGSKEPEKKDLFPSFHTDSDKLKRASKKPAKNDHVKIRSGENLFFLPKFPNLGTSPSHFRLSPRAICYILILHPHRAVDHFPSPPPPSTPLAHTFHAKLIKKP